MKERKCKSCQLRFMPQRPLQPVCSPRCNYEYQKILKKNKEARENKSLNLFNKAIKTGSTKSLKKKLDEIFSLYIRQRYATDAGFVVCYTCSKVLSWKKSDCGHFQSRRHISTRWDEKNCQVQCKGCNGFKQGEQFKFSKNLDNEFGPGTAESLRIKAMNKCKMGKFEYNLLIKMYTQKLEQCTTGSMNIQEN